MIHKKLKNYCIKSLALFVLMLSNVGYAEPTTTAPSDTAENSTHLVIPGLTTDAAAPSATSEGMPAIPDLSPDVSQNDPYEKFNRSMFIFNDKLDIYIVKPIATVYNTILPKPINQGIHNFFNNINNLPTIANDILQFNFYQAANDTWRLIINTTLGIGGLFDVASRMQLAPYTNDFGLTLASWGYRHSNYVVWPFFGPSSIRDGVGIPVDYFAFSIYPHVHPVSTRYIVYTVGVIDKRAQLLQFQSVFDEAMLDKYTFFRNAYLQRRAYQIDQNQHLGYKDRVALAAPSANQP